jgi:hypothetical protein
MSYVTWKQVEYVATLKTMNIKANASVLLATFTYESDWQTLKTVSDNVDKSYKVSVATINN